MLTMIASPRRGNYGVTRRDCLQVGSLAMLGGLGLADLLRAESTLRKGTRPGKAKNVIVLFLVGGASTQDMYDLKPDAPAEIRSEFKPVTTNVVGIQVCEHLPGVARWMHKTAIVRTVNHKAGCHNPLPTFSGYDGLLPDIISTRDSYPPSMGSVYEYLKQGQDDLPAYVCIPNYPGYGESVRLPGPYGGFLGRRYDPFFSECNPWLEREMAQDSRECFLWFGQPTIADGTLAEGVTPERLKARQTLLRQFDDRLHRADHDAHLARFDLHQRRAFSLLTSAKLKGAFDLATVDPRVRERYGRTLVGSSALVARRLIEAGVRFVNVVWDGYKRLGYLYDIHWDTHWDNFNILRTVLLPNFDQIYSALIEDLEARGLLDETLVAVLSDFGRTPRINATVGRDHWTYCYSVLLAGAGIRGGTIYGVSDEQGAFVKENPVRPADIVATIYECLGIDPEMPLYDLGGRPQPVAQGGRPIREILA